MPDLAELVEPAGERIRSTRPAGLAPARLRPDIQARTAWNERWPPRRPAQRWLSLGLALLVEFTLAFAVLHAVLPVPAKVNEVEVRLLAPPTETVEPVLARPTEPTLPRLTVALPPTPQIRTEEIPLPPTTLPQPSNAISLPAPSPPPPPSPAAAPGIEDSFKAAVRSAVLAAWRVPASAKLLGQYGETRIGFSLVDGIVSNVHVVRPSGHASLDEAALAAARLAAYPPVPPALRGRVLAFEIVLYSQRGAP
jgi:TonB family protein